MLDLDETELDDESRVAIETLQVELQDADSQPEVTTKNGG